MESPTPPSGPDNDPTFSPSAPGARHDSYAALRYRDFRFLTIGTLASSLGSQMLGVAVGWELYERTNSAFVLGIVGLVQVIPVLLFSLYAGHIADRFDRKRIVMLSQALLLLCSLGLAVWSYGQGSLLLAFTCLGLIGVARAFGGPAGSALLPQTVPPPVFMNAATWSSSSGQLAAVVGPGLGGLMIAQFGSATAVYLVDAVAVLTFVLLLSMIPRRVVTAVSEPATLQSLLAGIRFIYRTKVVLASITLDLFAVLLGGATALLPVFAKDILEVGPTGLGWLRTAPSVGAILVALVLAHRPPFKHAGKTLLWTVAGFGVATIIFGFSESFWLSVAMLALLGAFDGVSMVIRHVLVLVKTPDEMRVRVNAVEGVFIGASNELGAFESGVAAALLGPVLAVASGGVGTILVVIFIALAWPEVRRLRQISEG
ncbi:MAG: Uncharacterized MFS-type transporter [uncultured Chloroflexia bacterium]|uniref:Uncharacterized MFS-type transporter n=1 Tax=uncultured Chloroflexia bacterium TaxID=1672391 RepID=A0A6J4IVS2_9CHLR|nr:MAG: Uncharacterized MFS-type transporter [uncultured Chloroflexia bacterium]